MNMKAQPENWPDGYWNDLAKLEILAIDKNYENLQTWDKLAEKCMNLAIKAPFLPATNTNSRSLKLSAAFLKRAMSDFRGLWILINWGYPYQAACIAASLYENALVVNCISGRDDLADLIINNTGGDVPWKPQQLAKMAAQRDLYGEIKSIPPKDQNFDNAWKLCYRNYKLLCKMKHPTLQQVKDETEHALNCNGQFVVIPFPDSRDSSLGLKHLIMIIAISRIFSAAKCFAISSKCNHDNLDYKKFIDDAKEIYSDLQEHIRNSEISKIPIKLDKFPF
ncbi:hypothetical protein NMD15_06945 [Plesiomonas shigelloides]|uniref:hypothetical protein n=1 Tax=Plesiomonas shigelloides TaxID=703 RepID=UPI00351CE0AE